ncbi:hypothetical protein E1286_04950 [Nonomuraea terrae]|uniref:Uncharacterized protein n=1 Tax=Nonomuraea terrae TaxID=2530383 RepID=A0A4R4Z8C2_9ACTN|nr:hypothetical protein [Nonomuraea terrae]TDD54541.1 hypothetical protein E1286_04950 [Nonomuraea terrae]
MSNPYATDTPALPALTEAGIAHFRKLNERDEKELDILRSERTRLKAEIASIDSVVTDLHETIGRRQAKMRGDVIAQLPLGAVPPRSNGSDVIEPTTVQGPGSFPETKPDGHCVHCLEPVWQVSISPASPKGYRHSYGATCNPEDPHSGVAEVDEADTKAIQS